MLRCASSSAFFTSAMQESNTQVKQHRIAVMCNVQKKSYGVWAMSHLMREMCHRPQHKPIYMIQQNTPWTTITVNQHPLYCTRTSEEREEETGWHCPGEGLTALNIHSFCVNKLTPPLLCPIPRPPSQPLTSLISCQCEPETCGNHRNLITFVLHVSNATTRYKNI